MLFREHAFVQDSGNENTLRLTPEKHDVLALFINPEGSDRYTPLNPTAGGLDNTAEVIQTGFTSSSWSTRLRVQSASPILTAGTGTWDNLTVGTSPIDVGLAVPEPAAFSLLILAGAASLKRKRGGCV